MGWTTEENPGHEGYVIGLVPDRELGGVVRLRELRYPDDQAVVERVERVVVGCDCGWRSPHLLAPSGTSYAPFVCDLGGGALSEAYRGRARRLWQAHVHDVDEFRRRGPRTFMGREAGVEWLLYGEDA
jgi:hypothetical protein